MTVFECKNIRFISILSRLSWRHLQHMTTIKMCWEHRKNIYQRKLLWLLSKMSTYWNLFLWDICCQEGYLHTTHSCTLFIMKWQNLFKLKSRWWVQNQWLIVYLDSDWFSTNMKGLLILLLIEFCQELRKIKNKPNRVSYHLTTLLIWWRLSVHILCRREIQMLWDKYVIRSLRMGRVLWRKYNSTFW